MRVKGLDVHRTFAEGVFLEDGRCRSGGRVDLTAERLTRFGKRLLLTDEVELEATGNTAAIMRSLKPGFAQVVIANPPTSTGHRTRAGQDGQDRCSGARAASRKRLPADCVDAPDPDTERCPCLSYYRVAAKR